MSTTHSHSNEPATSLAGQTLESERQTPRDRLSFDPFAVQSTSKSCLPFRCGLDIRPNGERSVRMRYVPVDMVMERLGVALERNKTYSLPTCIAVSGSSKFVTVLSVRPSTTKVPPG